MTNITDPKTLVWYVVSTNRKCSSTVCLFVCLFWLSPQIFYSMYSTCTEENVLMTTCLIGDGVREVVGREGGASGGRRKGDGM